MTEIIFEPFVGPTHYVGHSGSTSLLPALLSFGAQTLTLPYGAGNLPAIVQISPSRVASGNSALAFIENYGVENLDLLGGRGDTPCLETHGTDNAVEPEYYIGYSIVPPLESISVAIVNHVGTQDAELPSLLSASYEFSGVIGTSELPKLISAGLDHLPQNYITLFQSPGVLTLIGGQEALLLVDSASVSAELVGSYAKNIVETGVLQVSLNSVLQATSSLVQNSIASDVASHIAMLLIDATATVADAPENFLTAIDVAIDTLIATDGVLTSLDAFCLIVEALQASDATLAAIIATLEDGGSASDATTNLLRAIAALVENSTGVDEVAASIRIIAFVEDTGVVADDVVAQLSALLSLFETGQAVASLFLAGEAYTAYAMTLAGAAVNEYVGYNFNSFAVINGVAYGGSENGIFLLEGATDDGVQIDASVRVGLSNFGTALKKEISYAYIGVTTDGQMAMKVTTTSRDKGKRENWYKFSAKPRTSTAEDRLQISKGKQSVYWDFELINLEGADFEFDQMRVWVMPLNRRK